MNSKWIAAVALGAALVIQGCAGDKGAAGPAGASGANGTNGTNGRDGADLTRAPRHVILVIGDGMQLAHEVAASRYLTGRDAGLVFTPDVVIGGGWPFDPNHANTSYKFIAKAEYDALYAGSTAYTFVERIPGRAGGARLLAAAASLPAGGKLFGLFGAQSSDVDGSFEPPVPTADPITLVTAGTLAHENPTLAEATEAALTVLSRNPNGFFAMIEQGDIDWANHAGNLEWLFGTVWDLDQAVSTAIAFVDRPGDDITWENTLLVVTADHGNNYLRLGATSLGKGQLPAMDTQKRPTDAAQFTMYPLNGASSWNHTNELVSVYAKGATSRELFRSRTGTWYPGAHIVDNTQIHDVMAEFLGLR